MGTILLTLIREQRKFMHVISRKILRDYGTKRTDAKAELDAWFHEVAKAMWKKSAHLKAKYGNASVINAERVVFNICGNKHRLVARINYVSQTVFIRFVGTPREYDRINVETV